MESATTPIGKPQPRASIQKIDPYAPGKGSDQDGAKSYKLSSNESPLGTSERARSAYLGMVENLHAYPDGSATSLRKAIGEVHGLNPNHLICGAGSDELLNLIASAYLCPGDEGIYSQHGFLMYQIAIRAAGATPVVAKERNLTTDVDAVLNSVTDHTKIVFLANPNNPTGTYLSFEEVNRLHKGLPDHVLLVIDAAYAEYVRNNDYESGLALVSSSDNVVMTRTFSKIFGLASLRLGWAYAPAHIIDTLNRIRGPFNVTGAALAAGIEALNDSKFLAECVEHNEIWLPWLTGQISELGLEVTPSVGNFILIHFPEAEKKSASQADSYLSTRGCILRAMGAYGFPNALRMSVGTEEANRSVVKHLKSFLSN